MMFHQTPMSKILFVAFVHFCSILAEVYELNKDSIESFRKGKLLVVIFVDSPTCSRCRVQFPFFVATSQAFPSDPEVFFARVHDPRLVQEWGITELPALLYYRNGLEEPDFFMVDVTVDDITDEIARRLHDNFGGMERFYAVELTPKNFREIVKTPKQSVLLLVYDKNTKEEVKVMEQVAKVYRNDEAILICKLNVDKEKELRDSEFKSRDVPAVFWYSADDKQVPKRFGGPITIYIATTFINEQTGLNRHPDGNLKPTSGRIESYDVKVLENADRVLSGDKVAVSQLTSHLLIEKSHLRWHEVDWANYYIFLLDKIGEKGSMDIVQLQMDDIVRKLEERDEMLSKQEDLLKRKRNILIFFQSLAEESAKLKKQKEEQRLKEEKESKKKEEEEAKRQKEKEQQEDDILKVTTKVVPRRRRDQLDQYTARATIHRRVHEEL